MNEAASTGSPAMNPAVQAFLERRHGHFIDGRWVGASATLPVYDPATGEVLSHVAEATAAEIDQAVAAARRALEGGWARRRPADRERILHRLADLIEQHGDELSELETRNQGKSIALSRMIEVGGSAEFTRYMAGWATKIEGTTLDVSIPFPPGTRYRAMTLRQPVGVVGAITPWNFPLTMAIWKIAPALACGCTVVLKPAEETPLTALRLAELCVEAGVPDGVVNVVTGRGESAGATLSNHPGVDKLAFTGSTEVGKLIGHAAVENMTRVSLELGGKSPVIMFDDVDLDTAVQGAAAAIFFNQGQVCTAGSRLYVHRRIFDRVVAGVADGASKMSLGSGLDPANQINPLVSSRHRERVCSYIEQGIAAGAKALSGGGAADRPGYFVKPTVLVDVKPDMSVVREEIFGPVLVAAPFDNVEDVLGQANDTVYGLGASIWTNDHKRIMGLIHDVKAGTVWVNTHNMIDPNVPFGGFKQSGIGREMGRNMIDLYTESKSVIFAY